MIELFWTFTALFLILWFSSWVSALFVLLDEPYTPKFISIWWIVCWFLWMFCLVLFVSLSNTTESREKEVRECQRIIENEEEYILFWKNE